MNDKAVNVLEQYDMTVTHTFKGRGTIICDTDKGMRILKEYKGKTEKLALLEQLQQKISDGIKTDTIVRNKEGELFAKDIDGTNYILKQQVEGRECSYKSEDDIIKAFAAMAKLHLKMSTQAEYEMPVFFFGDDMEKHTKECRHVKNYLRKLKIKTDFERRLLREYDYFLGKAEEITKLANLESKAEHEAYIRSNGLYCHGDYQYHNVIFTKGNASVGIINFEHFAHDMGTRDFYLLFRKIEEKNNWSADAAKLMLDAYQTKRCLTPIEWRSLRLRLAYPEKFWKIINFYYNSRKTLISDRNQEKLEKLINQEKSKETLLETFF